MSILAEELNSAAELGGILLDVDQKFQHCDYKPALNEFVGVLEREHAANWDGRHSPAGEPWAPLSEYTIQKKGHDKPLVLSGALREAMANRNGQGHIGEVFDHGLTYGTDIEYAAFHQDGTSRIPQREFAGMSEAVLNDFVDTVADHVVESLKYTIRG